MESPSDWDLLTASLAVTDLRRPSSAWAFLVVQGLMRDNPGDHDVFIKIVRDQIKKGPTTGPSPAAMVAGELVKAGIVHLESNIDDPGGEVATKRLQIILQWGGKILGREQARDLEHFRRKFHHAEEGKKNRWWEFWK